LANVASSIAQRNGGRKVLAVDWDLEAPGLHRYFRPYLKVSDPDRRESEVEVHPGLIELLTKARDRAFGLPDDAERDELRKSVFEPLNLDSYLMPTDRAGLFLLKAGRFDSGYSSRINTFDWEGLFRNQPLFFSAFADFLSQRFDFVFIDSRTGYTDISGICTCLMPDTLVAVFTPNRQSLWGALTMVRQAATYRMNSDDLRPLKTFPLVSRVELSEKKLNDSWRTGNVAEEITGYEPEFERLFKEVYRLDECNLSKYFDEAQAQYVPFYAFGEEIAVRQGETSHFSLGRSYEVFTDILLGSTAAWEFSGRDDLNGLSTIEASLENATGPEWFERHKRFALQGLQASGKSAFMEVRFSLSRVKVAASRLQLRAAAAASQVTSSARPFGMVGSEQTDEDGIAAQFSARDYDYWALRENGDYFLLRSLSEAAEGTRHLWAGELVQQIAESLMFCSRLYTRLEVTPRAEVRIEIIYSGLAGWTLRVPAELGGGSYYPSSTTVSETRNQASVVLGRIESDLSNLVKSLAGPLIEIFDFATLPDSDYKQMIDSFKKSKMR
jgi:hypothetical protein